MSTAQPIRPRMVGKARLSFAVIASQYNVNYVQGMVEQAHRELSELEPGAKIKIIWASGAFEIPLLAKVAMTQKKYDAVLALGVILQGETAHARLVAEAVTSALLQIALEFTVPVINEVLLLDNEEQAKARCLDPEINRGIEAARAAVATSRAIRDLSSTPA